MIGKTISHYKIIEKLGEGGMGEVYLAEDNHLLRNVALKILPQKLVSDKNNQKRFIKEAQTASSLNHPNICIIHDINESENYNFIVMEYIDGQTLREIINERGPLKEDEVIEIAVKICDALAAVHSKGVSHRDVKPENIMISKEGYLKVMDFGLAKLATEAAEIIADFQIDDGNRVQESGWNKKYSEDVVLSTLSGLLGTVSYMSPEQALGNTVDHRSDIFSLGIVLYELLTGIRPFDGDSNDTILSKIIVETLKPIRLNTKNISTKMEEIIDRCLEKDPSKRYKTISRLLIDLLSIKQDSESLQKGESKYELKDKRAIETHEQERRQVTVMFVAIANYKRILSVNDPEEASTAVNHLYDLLASVVEKYSGRIDKIASGTVQIIYGAPVASENAKKEALNTAIEIRNKIAKYNQNQKIQIELKIGINSGIVIAGIMRTDDKKNYTVFGETVNHASNLKDLCENGQIYVGSLVYKLTKNEFEYKELSPIFLKENESKSAVYILLSVKEKIHRAKLGSGRQIYSKMVGRDKELVKLELRVSKLINGEGFIVNVIGEAGIGKSRLKAELRDNDKISQVTFLEGRSLSIGKNLSFHPLIDILKNWSGITEDDTENEAFQKLENLVRDIYPENLEEVFPFVATLMSMELTGYYAARVKGIKGEALEKLILKNLRDFIEKAASQNPIVFVMEDLHWADITSIEFLESLFRLAKNNRILFVNIFRLNYKDTGERILESVKERYTDMHEEIVLELLTELDGQTLINNLLNIEGFPLNIINMIAKRTGGNPFFIEEVVRSFIDNGAIEIKNNKFVVTEKINSIVIPETINEVLISRIDKLDEGTKSLLKKASVIGRNFFHKIIAEVANVIDDLDDRLVYLKDIQLIKEQKRMDEVEYLFKHALAHEAVYESILLKKRKELHIKTAKAIESSFSDKLPKFYGILSYHYSKGEELDKAEEYLIKAGEEALKSSASNEAINFFKDALELYINKYETSVDPKRKTILEYNIAVALQNKGRYAESIEYFDSVQAYYGYPLPKNKVMLVMVSILGYLHLFVAVTFPSLKWNKSHNNDVLEKINFWLDFNNSITLIDPKRGFFEILNTWREFTNYDFSEFEDLKINMLGTSAVLSFAGIFSSISKKLLKLIQPKIENKNTPLLIWYRFAHQCNNWTRGYWKAEDEVSYDPNLVNYGSSIGEATFTTLYINQHNLTKIERGEFDKVQEMLDKISEIGEIYENEYVKCIRNLSQTKLFMKTRRISKTIGQVDQSIGLANQFKDNLTIFALLSYKSRVLILTNKLEEAEKILANAKNILPNISPPWYLSDYFTSKLNLDFCLLEKAIQNGNELEISEFSKKTLKSGKEAFKNSKKFAGDRIEIYRLMGTYYWLINKQKKASKWWEISIKAAEESGGKLELSRTFMEVGKRLSEKKSKFTELNGVMAEVYLEKARSLFKEMDLQWDLEQLEKIKLMSE